MKIAVIGANGKAGTLVVREATERGHEVTAIMRSEQPPSAAHPHSRTFSRSLATTCRGSMQW